MRQILLVSSMPTRRNALLRQTTRLGALLNQVNKPKARPRVSRTRYFNTKGRPILRSVRVAYIVKVGPKTLYGRKAARPVSLLAIAPYQIRP